MSLRKDVRVPIHSRQLFSKYVVRIWGCKVGQRQNLVALLNLCIYPRLSVGLRGGIKKLFFSSGKPRNGGGGLAESEISLSEKTKIFLDFFLQKGGGGSPIPKGFYHKISFLKKSNFV